MIRWLGADDLAEWRKIRSDALRETPSAFLTSLAEFEAQSDEQVRDRLAQGQVLAVFDGPRVVATTAFSQKTRPQTRHRAELSAFYVRAEARGAGVADRLMASVVDAASERGVVQLELWVYAGNPRAIAFYRRHGFEQSGVMPRAVVVDGVDHDDFFMVRALDR